MKTEELIALGLTEEQANKVFAMNGKDINEFKAKAETLENSSKDLQEQIKARDNDLEELKKHNGKELQASLTELQSKYEADTKTLSDKLVRQTLESKIDFALTNAKAKNLTAVRALLKLEDIKLDGDKLLGFDTQLEAMAKENPYLFGETEQNPPPGNGGSETKPADTLGGALAEHYKE